LLFLPSAPLCSRTSFSFSTNRTTNESPRAVVAAAGGQSRRPADALRRSDAKFAESPGDMVETGARKFPLPARKKGR
jgi:hypothetical protein